MQWSPAVSDIFDCVRMVKTISDEKREASYSARGERRDQLKMESSVMLRMYRDAMKQLEAL